MTRAWNSWCRFWFETESKDAMRILRFFLCFTLFFFYLSRTPDLGFFYSEQGLFPLKLIEDLVPYHYQWSLLKILPPTMGWVWVCHILLLVSLVASAFGVLPRLSAILAYVLHLSFVHRSILSIYGVDQIATFYLFFVIFAEDGRSKAGTLRQAVGSVAYRAAQIQLCVIYAYSGLEKLKGMQWWKGEAIWTVLANSQLARWDFSWMSHFPLVIVFATYTTLFWEIYFPILIWFPRLRAVMLAFGVMLHLGIAISINIPFFAMVMISTYAVFLKPEWCKKIISLFDGLMRRVAPSWSLSLFSTIGVKKIKGLG